MPRHTLPPKRAGRFVAWANSFSHGWTSLDDAADRIVGDDAWHRVDGLPSGDDVSLAVALGRLSVAGVRGFRLALPVPGDVSGLPGPLDFNVEALAAGEAVLLDGAGHGLVPTVARSEAMAGAEGVRWRLLSTEPPRGAGQGLAESDQGLAGALRTATQTLHGLDVAGMGSGTAQALADLRAQPSGAGALAPGYSDRAREVVRRAEWLLAIVALADDDPGAAVSAMELGARAEPLAEVARAARLAIVAAHNSMDEADRGERPEPR